MSGESVLTAWRPDNAAASLGLSVEYLRKKPAFAKLAFGEWSQVLVGQINRGHFLFVLDSDRRICGFLGWAFTHEALAEAWVEGRSGLTNEQCREGDCVILNAWAADNPRANRFIVNAGRKLFENRRTLYFKRHYPDGRVRPMRLAVTDFCASHLARAAVQPGNSTPAAVLPRSVADAAND